MAFDRLHDLLEAYRDVLSLPVEALDTQVLSELARALEEDGHIAQAVAALEFARVIAPEDETTARESDALFARLPAHIDHALLWTAATSAEPFEPDSNVVLVIGEESRPFSSSGAAERLHRIAEQYNAVGLDAHVTTLLPDPWVLNRPAVPLAETIDGVAYHRLVPFGPFPDAPLDLIAMNVDALGPLVARLRPATLHALPGFAAGQTIMILARRFGLSVVFEPETVYAPPQKLQGRYGSTW